MSAVYGIFALVFLLGATPILFECATRALNPRETKWNRQASALWFAVIATLCASWPLIVGLCIASGVIALRAAILAHFFPDRHAPVPPTHTTTTEDQ